MLYCWTLRGKLIHLLDGSYDLPLQIVFGLGQGCGQAADTRGQLTGGIQNRLPRGGAAGLGSTPRKLWKSWFNSAGTPEFPVGSK